MHVLISTHLTSIQFPHFTHIKFLLEQICNNPTVHYTTAPSYIQFPHFTYIKFWNKSTIILLYTHYCSLVYPVPSLRIPHKFLLEQIYNNPTVHYTTALSFIQFPHFMHLQYHPERTCADKGGLAVFMVSRPGCMCTSI